MIFFSDAVILHPLWAKVFKPETTSFHYFSPKYSEIFLSVDIWLQEVGAKRPLMKQLNNVLDKMSFNLEIYKKNTE